MADFASIVGGIGIFFLLSLLMLNPVEVTATDTQDIFGVCKQQNLSVNNCTVEFEAQMSVMEYSNQEGVIYDGNTTLSGLQADKITMGELCQIAEIECTEKIAPTSSWLVLNPETELRVNGNEVNE
jgi:hypothetical protein